MSYHKIKVKDEIKYVKIFLVIRMSNSLKLQIRHDNINVALKSINQNQNVLWVNKETMALVTTLVIM